MSKSYNRKSRTHASRKAAQEPRVPAWVWLFTGCVLGAFVMFLMRLSELDPVQKVAHKSAEKQAPKAEKQQAKPSEPRFDFYEILKETKISIPDFSELQQEKGKEGEQQSPQEYILQVASFREADDAEQLKVELILLNLQAEVEKARIRNGQTWHRVLVGPFTSRSQLAAARSTLVENRYEALVLKRAPSTTQ
ncbi:Cell division protein [Alteromonadaceae bacterium Bs31]|nr:Cell division protein [Alteromonadaceae bacterium Bs31]